MITIRLGDGPGAVALLVDPAAVAAQIEAHLPALIAGGAADLDPMQDAIRSAVKIPTRMLLRAIKRELQRSGAPESMWPRKVERGEDTLLYAARYLAGLVLLGAEAREWVADYADTDSGDIEIYGFRPRADDDPFSALAGPLPGAAAALASVAAGAGAGADGAGSARADDPRATADDGRVSGTDAAPVDGASVARAARQSFG